MNTVFADLLLFGAHRGARGSLFSGFVSMFDSVWPFSCSFFVDVFVMTFWCDFVFHGKNGHTHTHTHQFGLLFGSLGSLKKQLKVCVRVITFRGLAPSRQSPFSRPVLGPLFSTPFFAFGVVLAPLWPPRARPGSPKGSQKGAEIAKKREQN